ncbi:hypothetical protein FEM48_Zijuj11G0157500 [Ziziphus jujuba var. spinosa]|uniref:Uncharacterized protein n=1 Tax=Ziziphus jujuba var. spinosa TaxID=714518 RepID=A0A978UJU4_ZIZJJ|nr:hypothetical protein FEM48_Zijuj11G0157500 [Ziziphus jujuba var. spinosa]
MRLHNGMLIPFRHFLIFTLFFISLNVKPILTTKRSISTIHTDKSLMPLAPSGHQTGAKFFNEGLKKVKEPEEITNNEPASDTNGHGTFASSIAAGNYVSGVSYFDYAKGTAKGIAPRAPDSSVQSYMGFTSTSHSVAIASFAAMEKGTLVVFAAGNHGPLFGTVDNGFPWVLTVGASTTNRWFAGILTLGNGLNITGWSLFPGTISSLQNLPLVQQMEVVTEANVSGTMLFSDNPTCLESEEFHCPCPIRDNAFDYSMDATPLATGAGFIDLNKALVPGLIYDSTPQHYVQEFRRTVTNVGEGKATYRVSVTAPHDSEVTVSPEKLEFKTKSRTVLSKMSTTKPSLKFPKFVSVEGSDIFSRSKPGIKFSLVSYNILAQEIRYLLRGMRFRFPLSESDSLSLCNVLCEKSSLLSPSHLPEVDEYDSFYKGNMMSNGYSSIYIQRSGQKRDGCGIFFKHDSAELILHENIEYNDLVDSIQDENLASDDTKDDKQASKNECVEPKNGKYVLFHGFNFLPYGAWRSRTQVSEQRSWDKGNENLSSTIDPSIIRVCFSPIWTSELDDSSIDIVFVNSALESTSQDRGDPNDPRVRLKRDCVGVMAAFKLKDSYSHVVIIANTHIYWDPEWADVKLAQAKYLLSRLSQFKTLVSDRFECKPSVVVAGDFNSTPGDKVYEYVVSGNTTSAPMPESLDDLPIPLCSVYASTRGEPTFTNCTPDFTDTLDYIFYSPSDHVKPVSILELPELDSPDVSGGLPNYSYPSDHLPIGAEFEISRT